MLEDLVKRVELLEQRLDAMPKKHTVGYYKHQNKVLEIALQNARNEIANLNGRIAKMQSIK